MAVIAQLLATSMTPCAWLFTGYDDPAIDPAFGERVPVLRGSMMVPISTVTGALVEEPRQDQVDRQRAAIESFYLTQGVTAHDLQRMTAGEVASMVPVGTVRARAASEIPNDGWNRGCVASLSGAPRSLDNTCVPAIS